MTEIKECGWNAPWTPYPGAEIQYQDYFIHSKKVGKVLSYCHGTDIGYNAIIIKDDKEVFLGNYDSRLVAQNIVEHEVKK